MPATMEFRYTGGSTNTDPNASLGGVMSSTVIPDATMNNLFDDVSADEATNGVTDYRAIDIYNAGDATGTAVKIWVDQQPASGIQIEIGYDDTNSPHTADASLPSIASETEAPTGITFSAPDAGNKLSLEDCPAGQALRIWVKRTVPAGTGNTASDSTRIKIEYA